MNRGIWIAGVIALGLVILFLARTTDNDREEPAAPPPLPVPSPSPQPGIRVESLQCPACAGYGYVTTTARTGMRREVCQFCGGKGGKVLRIPPGYVRCPDCDGFGRKLARDGFVVCARCSATGIVKAPFQPTE